MNGLTVTGWFDVTDARSIEAGSSDRTLEIPVAFRSLRRDDWLAVTRIVVHATQTQPNEQVRFHTSRNAAGSPSGLIDVTPPGGADNANDLNSPIVLTPDQTLLATWPTNPAARSLYLRVCGYHIKPPGR